MWFKYIYINIYIYITKGNKMKSNSPLTSYLLPLSRSNPFKLLQPFFLVVSVSKYSMYMPTSSPSIINSRFCLLTFTMVYDNSFPFQF